MKKMIATFCLLAIVISIYATSDKNKVQASLKSVTVYRQGAEMVHSVSVTLKTGNNQILIDNISNAIDQPRKTSDSLDIILGNDKRVVINRKKLEDFSSVKFLGSNKLQKFTYEIAVKNDKKEMVNIVLKDQYPLSTDKDIEVALIETSNAVADKDNGSLTWQLTLAPDESKTLRFSYSVKYTKDKSINIY